MVSVDLIIALFFYGLLGIFLYLNRKKFTRQGIVILRKTQIGIKLMKKLGRYRWFWKIYGTIAIPTAVYFMIKVGSLLWTNAVGIVNGVSGAGVGIVIPGIKIPGSPIFIPFWYGIISIFVLAVVHEFSHGVVAAMEKIRIKSSGYGILAILPLAFVELDEKQMAKMSRLVRMRVLAAGAFANVLVFTIIFLFLGLVFTPLISSFIVPSNISLIGVTSGAPADLAGMKEGMIISAIGEESIGNVTQFMNIMKEYSPGDVVELKADDQIFSISLDSDPLNESKAYMGVFLEQKSEIRENALGFFTFLVPVFLWIYGLLYWIGFINLGVGVMNFLPIWVLDGGRICFDLLGSVIKNERFHRVLFNLIASTFLALLLFNIFGAAFF